VGAVVAAVVAAAAAVEVEVEGAAQLPTPLARWEATAALAVPLTR
jgi:hypothetical protein